MSQNGFSFKLHYSDKIIKLLIEGLYAPCWVSIRTEWSFFSNSILLKTKGRVSSLYDIKDKVGENPHPVVNPVHYKRVGRGVGDRCSFGAYFAKKGRKRVSMTPTIASM